MTQHRHQSTQSGRRAAAPDPQSVLPDPRDEVAMIRYIGDIAGLIRFSGCASDGCRTWADFLDTDPVFLMAEIASHLRQNAYYENRGDTGEALQEISQSLHDKLTGWQARAQRSGHSDLLDRLAVALDAAPAPVTEPLPETPGLMTAVAGPSPPDLSDVMSFVSPFDRAIRTLGAEVSDMLQHALTQRRDQPAHIGLLLAFLEMRKEVAAHLNDFTRAHLDFYYHEVLGLAPQSAQMDRAVVALEPAADAPPSVVPAGTTLEAGRTPEGLPVLYKTDQPLHTGHAKISQLFSLAVRNDRAGLIRQVLRCEATLPLSAPFAPFGAPGSGRDAETGIVITSPVLRLPGGAREITVSLTLTGSLDALHAILCEGAVDAADLGLAVHLSATDGPFCPRKCRLHQMVPDAQTLELSFELSPEDPALTAPDDPEDDSTGGRLDLTLVPTLHAHGAAYFAGVGVTSARVTARVRDMIPETVFTPEGETDTGSAFAPLGQQPLTDAAMIFTLPAGDEVAISDALLTLHWTGLPKAPAGFEHYYHGYRPPLRNTDFRAAIDTRDGARWSDATVDLPLFHTPAGALTGRTVFALTDGVTGRNAAFRLRLTGPAGGFGRDRFPAVFARAAIEKGRWWPKLKALPKTGLAKIRKALGAPEPEPLPEMPNPPFTPMAGRISLSWTATATSGAGPQMKGSLLERVPFAPHPLEERDTARFCHLPGAPDQTFAGTLYLGITGLATGDRLDLFVDIAEDVRRTSAVAAADAFQRISWSYLTQRGWSTLPPDCIADDQTAGLSRPGLLRLHLPEDASETAPEMPSGARWLALSLSGDAQTETVGRLRNILTCATSATRQSTALWDNAPAGSIRRVTDSAIAPLIRRVSQPQPATGGRPAETQAAFRTRVSERLRHKSRALQAVDFEQIALEAFPGISDARLIRSGPGRLSLVVCPQRSTEDPMPRTPPDTLQKIAALLQERMTVGGQITARDVLFEPVQIRAWIRYDRGLAHNTRTGVMRAIDHWIAPWHADPGMPCPIGTGRLDPAALQASLAGLPGVQSVTGLTLTRISRSGGSQSGAVTPVFHDLAHAATQDPGPGAAQGSRVLLPGTSGSVFVPADEHILHAVTDSHETEVPDDAASPAPPGVGVMRIGGSLVTTADPRRTAVATDKTG